MDIKGSNPRIVMKPPGCCELLSIFVILIRLYSPLKELPEGTDVVNCSQSL